MRRQTIFLLPLVLLTHILWADSIGVYRADGLDFKEEEHVDITIDGKERLRLSAMPSTIYSDHEMMLIERGSMKIISYNIGQQFELIKGESPHFNNGFMREEEDEQDYLARITRLIERIKEAVFMESVLIVCLQEVPDSNRLDIQWFRNLIEENFPDFAVDHQGENMMLVAERLGSRSVDLSELDFHNNMKFRSAHKRMMARFLPSSSVISEPMVVLNQHARFLSVLEESEGHEKNYVIPTFNMVFAEIGRLHGSIAVSVVGDFNREDYNLVDRQLARDITDFASFLELDERQVFSSGSYTNVTWTWTDRTPLLLTSSDYLITGRASLPF